MPSFSLLARSSIASLIRLPRVSSFFGSGFARVFGSALAALIGSTISGFATAGGASFRAFADSVGEFDFDAAEGWFATARLQSGRAASHGHPRGTNQGVSRRVRRSA